MADGSTRQRFSRRLYGWHPSVDAKSGTLGTLALNPCFGQQESIGVAPMGAWVPPVPAPVDLLLQELTSELSGLLVVEDRDSFDVTDLVPTEQPH